MNNIFATKLHRLNKSILLPLNLVENRHFIKKLKKFLVKESFFKKIYNFFNEKFLLEFFKIND